MAASKPTASSAPRKLKAASKPKPGKKATPKRLTSAEPFGILGDGSIVATAARLGEGLEKLHDVPRGEVVWVLCTNDSAVQEAERKARQRATLDVVADLLGDKIELCEPFGQTFGGLGRGMRRATDRECSLARLNTAEHLTIDLNRDIPAQVVEKLTAYAKRLQAAADRVKAAHKAGKIPRPTIRRGKAVPA